MNVLLLVVLSQIPLSVFDNEGAFTEVERGEGFVLSKRPITDSPFFEYRMTVDSEDQVLDLCSAIYDWGTAKNDNPGVTLNKVLEEKGESRVVYTQMSQPVVAKRDYAMTVVKEKATESLCRIRFRVTNEHAPELPQGFVRIEKVWGEWLVTAKPEKGATIRYTMFSDPAGSVPAFLVHGSQRNATKSSVFAAVRKTREWVQGGRK